MKYKIAPLLDWYKKDWRRLSELEKYKWKAVKTFQDNYDRIFDKTEKLHSVLRVAFKDTKNLFYYAQLDSLISNAEYAADDIREALHILFDESRDLEYRVQEYRKKFHDITIRNNSAGHFHGQTKTKTQDDRTISIYLALRYPGKYYFYMSSIFEKVAKLLEYEYRYIRTEKGDISNLRNFFTLCDEVRLSITQDNELMNLYKLFLNSPDIYNDSTANLLTQTFIYSICRHLQKESKYVEYKTLDKNRAKLLLPPKPTFKKSSHDIDYIKEAKSQSTLGKLGEDFVVAQENKRLELLGLKCIHKSREKGGDGYGYDILSYDDKGENMRYIEVKTTKSGFSSPFYMSSKEVEFSSQHADNYYLYRVYNYDINRNDGEIMVIKGDMTDYAKVPIQFRIALKEDNP